MSLWPLGFHARGCASLLETSSREIFPPLADTMLSVVRYPQAFERCSSSKRMLPLPGSHVGVAARRVTRRAPPSPPFVRITQTPAGDVPVGRTNAIRRPSGDHVWAQPCASVLGLPPSAGTTRISSSTCAFSSLQL